MDYQITAIPMTLCDPEGRSLIAKFFKCVFSVHLCSSWRDFNWHNALRGPSATAELFVYCTLCN